ncbi:hypothetical protein M5W68_21600 [Paenibacillus larvae]|uniref:hypothetical protein n=1 Tax=Paenibacillus larvae TaxID=1464 RepID=UPI0022801432|nr:hypothetical protein [Paenibacillus larvae]MCY9511416.1 hypothetical protein [Paenibacillus larvae]MCY9527615.1 hypothetical protein [Paenibacillus larvae]
MKNENYEIYAEIDGIYVTNNAYDAIMLKNGTFLQVTSKIFAEYINKAINLNDWDGDEFWDDWAANLETAAEGTGDVLAYYQGNEMVIVDAAGFEKRREFFLGE